jgi:hypothetical protein
MTKKKKLDINFLSVEQQKVLFAETMANSIVKLVDTVIQQRCKQFTDVIYEAMQKQSANALKKGTGE